MRVLTVRHVTTYRYSQPVTFGEHCMMFRPRESHDLRLVSTRLHIVPRPCDIRWLHDVFDNSVAIATFDTAASELMFDSTITLEHTETPMPHYALAAGAQTYPFRYPADEQPDLLGGLMRRYPADDLGGRWHIFDPRNNVPRIGRILMARGRDATDVAISNNFGPSFLAGFTVWTDEV